MAILSLEKIEKDGIELNKQMELVRSLLEEIKAARKPANRAR